MNLKRIQIDEVSQTKRNKEKNILATWWGNGFNGLISHPDVDDVK